MLKNARKPGYVPMELTREQTNSLDGELDAIGQYISMDFRRSGARGLALFSCQTAGLWRVIPLAVPVENRLLIDRQPRIAPLSEIIDRHGLIVATEDEMPRGFVDAGFGPNEEYTAIDTSLGTTCMLLLRGGHEDQELADRLLAASEDYLRSRGASVLYAGGIKPMNSFYLGLYGGSEIPGILDSNKLLRETCIERGYRETSQIPILQADLKTFRPSLSRKVRQLRRQTVIVETIDPVSSTWWESCVWGAMQRDLFQLVDRSQDRVVATASFWDIQPLSTSWGVCTAGLFALYVEQIGRASCRERV